eukprot:scaffold21718_cov58-Phaeocystis_antarctica.AAC.2
MHAILSTDSVDLATDSDQPQRMALPAIGLRVVHLRRIERQILKCGSIRTAHGVELAIESDAAERGAWARHACQLRPRSILRVVQLRRAELIAAIAANNVDQAGPAARARHNLRAVGCGDQCVPDHTLPTLGVERGPRTHGLAQKARRHHREAHMLHHRKQLGLGPLASLPPPLDPQEHRLLALGHQPVLLHQRQHLRARRQLRRHLLEAAQRRLHRGLLERRQREDIGEPPHVERVGRREARADRVGARLLQRVDHKARGCL